MSLARPLAAAALVALAGLLCLVAVQAWRLPGETRESDRALLGPPRSAAGWSGLDGPLPTVLGLRDDRTFRLAVERFLLARRNLDPISQGPAAAVLVSTEAAVLLSRVEHGRSARPVRSRAANLDAVVIGEGAELNGDVAALDAAADELRSAIRLDRSNEAAKVNLERLLSGSAPESALGRDASSGQLGGKPGGGAAGNGY